MKLTIQLKANYYLDSIVINQQFVTYFLYYLISYRTIELRLVSADWLVEVDVLTNIVQ